jgi:hypothetical protein
VGEEGAIQIRSYRVCFDLERRIHKIDRWRVPLPYGVPVRGLAYFGAALVLVLVLSQLPVTGQLLGILHPALRLAVLPIGVAAMLTRWSLDGRSAHQVGLAWARLQVEPRRLAAFRPVPAAGSVELDEVALAPDDRSARMRPATVQGPARVVLRYPVETRVRGRTLHVAQGDGGPLWRGKQVDLKTGQRLVVG